MPEPASAPHGGFRFRKLDKPEEFRSAEQVEAEALGTGGEAPLGATVQRVIQDEGGLVLGAFADIYLAGLTAGFLGWDGTQLYHRTMITAVRPEYQSHGVAFRLNAFLREEVLRLGLPRIVGTFDPLRSRQAHLVLRRLGARPERYLTHYFGRLDSAADRGLETDRLRVRWDLTDPSVEGRIAGRLPPSEEDRARWAASMSIVDTEISEEGLRRPVAVGEPAGASAHLEIPFDLDAIQEHAPGLLRPWRHAVRDGFRAAFDLGYQVDDFAVLNLEHERRGFYLLRPAGPAPADGATAPAPPPVPSG
ncbi:MAG: hypothetical protein ACRECR_01930 [Thermoplasmata archaeon]